MDRIDPGLSQSLAPQPSSFHRSERPRSEALNRIGALGPPGRPSVQMMRRAGFRPWGWLAAALFLLAAAILPAQAQSPAPVVFGVYRLMWTGLDPSGPDTLDVLTNTIYNPNWPDNPDPSYTEVFTNFETEVNSGLNYYGQQVRAFVVPPTNGNYLFWIASDDTSELFVSTDETPANKAPAAWVGDYSWTPSEDWTVYPSQQSAPIPLEGGRRYYVEALMQQGSGGDNLSVRWQLPDGTYEEPMTAVSPAGTLLIPFDGFDTLPGIYQQTTNLTVFEASNVGLSVLVTNSSPVTYAWLLQGANLPGPNAAKPFYNVNGVSVAVNNGQIYSCVVSNSAGAVTSAPVLLNVIRDTNPPTVAVVGNVGATNVQVVYSKTVELASAANPANYAFTNGLRVTAASLGPDNMTVTLTTAPLVYGSNYTLVINHVRDRASVPNTIAANTTLSFLATVYAAADIGKPSLPSAVTPVGTTGLDVSSAGAQVGGAADQFSFNYQFRSGDFDVAVRLAGMVPSDPFAKAGLMARESLLPSARFAAALATPAMVGSCFEWRDPAASQANSTGTFPANYPDTWLRLKRTGITFTGFASYDGQTWVQLGSAVITMSTQIYLGFAASSYNAAQPTLVQFRDLATATVAVTAAPPNPHEPLGPCSRRTPLVISEIMYNPAPRADGNNLEFLEIYNTNPWFQDLSGYQVVANNMSYTFPAGTVLNGGAFLVIAASPPSIQTVYGITNVVGPYLGSLRSKGTIQLLDNQGAVLLSIPYSNVRPWPVAADGTGHSIVLANPTYGEAQPQAWDISDVVGGSPGQGEAYRPSPLRNVLINEVLAHSENSALPCFIELYNHSNQTNDLSGCILTDDFATNKFVIPPGTRIPPRGFLSFDQSQLGFVPSAAGGTLFFVNPDGSRALDAVQFEGQADGVSLGRWPDGAAAFYPLAARTPGTNNSPVWIGDIVINELMYDPISGNDDDQYIELYNRGANTVDLANWQFSAGVSFTFPSGVSLAPDGYLVVAANLTNLLAKYPNLNTSNTVGDFGGRLSHKGERLALAMPQVLTMAKAQGSVTNLIYVVQDEVSYDTGGRWGQWAHGGGSSLELINPNSNHRLACNWADSDETRKSAWTNFQYTGLLDNGANYGASIDHVQLGILDVGECLVDNIAVLPGGTNGPNVVANSTFETGLGGWTLEGDHERSSLETATGLGGYQSSQSLHLRSSDSVWTLVDYAQGALGQNTLTNGQTATLRLQARWLHGWPEVLMRLRGNWLEVTGKMPVPANLGTPGMRNSRYVANAGPAIYEVKHSPPLPATNQALVVSARFHDVNPLQPTLLYRIDTKTNPTPAYISVPMVDNGTNGDAVAGDGIFSATIPAQPAGTIVAFLVGARDSLGATNLFPADIKSNAGVPRECVVGFGDPIPVGSFAHQHVFITTNWANRWAQGAPGVSHEEHDGTWVDGGGRIIYDWMGRYAGSPAHQYLDSPVTTLGGFHWDVPRDDLLYGVAALDKQHVPGNGPLDDDTLQREQASYWMAQQIGLRGENRRYYFYFVNGVRHGPLMEDAQAPDADVLKEYFPADNGGYLYKNHVWFEGDVEPQPGGYMNVSWDSWSVLGRFTTTINGLTNQDKLARYRWIYWSRQYPATGSANDHSQVFNLIDAANIPTNNPDYYAQMEAQVDTEQWLRLSAIEHATGDWDSYFTQNQWNMYIYKPTQGKWTALKWDWNITLGGGTSTWGPDGGNLFNYGANDPIMGTFHSYPAYQRAYLRAFQDIASYAMNNSLINPMLEAKYAAFVANGLTTTTWSGMTVADPRASLERWIATMHNSLLAALAGSGVTNIPFAITSVTVKNDLATISGTAPLAVKTLWFNGLACPLTWPTVTGWTATVPLQPGTNFLSVVGVDIHGQPVSGASATATAPFNGTIPSPAGLVVINEIMYNPQVPNAQYIELYNRSPNITFDLSGWQLQGIGYTFPGGSMIGPNSFLILAADRSAFTTAYGPSNLVFDTFLGNLPASGELLTLIQPGLTPTSNLIVAQVRYANTPPWPAAANRPGSALQLIDARQDNWRAGNWTAVPTNATALPHWVQVYTSIPATSSTLLLYLESAGDTYLDDIELLDANGVNRLADGNFESPLDSVWNLTPDFAQSALSTAAAHSGNSSLHIVAAAAGTGSGNAIYQEINPPLALGQYYTLSFWYLQSTNRGPLVVELDSSSNPVIVDNLSPPRTKLAQATPDAFNSVADVLTPFPPLWLNELQADNLSGITNAAGQRVPWLELYNPSPSVVSLGGLCLANNYSNLTQWAFPATASINPGQFKIIFADGQTNLSTPTELHTSFVLPSPTGSLALSRLFNGQPQVLDFVDYTNLPPNYSYGSLPDGQAFTRQQFFYATPGGRNNGPLPVSFISYAAAGSVYTQNFDSLPNPGPVSIDSANPVTINGITYSLPNPFDFAAPPAASGPNGGLGLAPMAGWFGLASASAGAGARFGASYGDQATGGQISFGPPNSPNRALGLLATSITGPTAFGAKFINQTTNTFNLVSLQLTGELWRQSDISKTLQCYYLIDPTAALPFSTSFSGSIPSLNVSFPALPAAVGGLAVDGTLAANQTNLSVVNQTIANWPPGAALWLLWVMADPTDNAQGLAIDGLSFSASVLPSAPAPQLGAVGLNNGSLTFSWPGVPGQTYRVQYTDALEAPDWNSITPDLTGDGSPLSVTVPVSGTPQRFYRVVLIQP